MIGEERQIAWRRRYDNGKIHVLDNTIGGFYVAVRTSFLRLLNFSTYSSLAVAAQHFLAPNMIQSSLCLSNKSGPWPSLVFRGRHLRRSKPTVSLLDLPYLFVLPLMTKKVTEGLSQITNPIRPPSRPPFFPPFGVLLCATTECLRRKGNAPAKR